MTNQNDSATKFYYEVTPKWEDEQTTSNGNFCANVGSDHVRMIRCRSGYGWHYFVRVVNGVERGTRDLADGLVMWMTLAEAQDIAAAGHTVRGHGF